MFKRVFPRPSAHNHNQNTSSLVLINKLFVVWPPLYARTYPVRTMLASETQFLPIQTREIIQLATSPVSRLLLWMSQFRLQLSLRPRVRPHEPVLQMGLH